MSKPTPLSPWFVVVRTESVYAEEIGTNASQLLWFVDADGTEQWSDDRTQARLFNSLHSAYRLASANGAYVIALADEEALKEFRPRGL